MVFSDLRKIESKTKQILKELKEAYPKLDARLVFSSRHGQLEFGALAPDALASFPAMFVDSEQKQRGLDLAKRLKAALREKEDFLAKNKPSREVIARLESQIAALKGELGSVSESLALDEAVEIALRFGELSYELVAQLQSDSRVDPERAQNSSASIHIVLGVIRDFI
ncbi:MAG: hypothetical protein EBX52_04505 [Proteobacteria bacterium]|nr:hypothetical protein [Pseudomonadota bacterium]